MWHGATVTDTFPDTLTDVAWTAVITGSGAATLTGSGDLNELVDLTSGSFITYTITGTVFVAGTANQTVDAIVTNTARVTTAATTRQQTHQQRCTRQRHRRLGGDRWRRHIYG